LFEHCILSFVYFFCTVPYPGVDKVKVKVNVGVKVNVRRRLGEGTPSASVAKVRRRLGEGVGDVAQLRRHPNRASPRSNVTEVRRSQCGYPIPMGRKDHGGSDTVGGPQIPMSREVIKRRERWLQGHSDSISVGQPDS